MTFTKTLWTSFKYSCMYLSFKNLEGKIIKTTLHTQKNLWLDSTQVSSGDRFEHDHIITTAFKTGSHSMQEVVITHLEHSYNIVFKPCIVAIQTLSPVTEVAQCPLSVFPHGALEPPCTLTVASVSSQWAF